MSMFIRYPLTLIISMLVASSSVLHSQSEGLNDADKFYISTDVLDLAQGNINLHLERSLSPRSAIFVEPRWSSHSVYLYDYYKTPQANPAFEPRFLRRAYSTLTVLAAYRNYVANPERRGRLWWDAGGSISFQSEPSSAFTEALLLLNPDRGTITIYPSLGAFARLGFRYALGRGYMVSADFTMMYQIRRYSQTVAGRKTPSWDIELDWYPAPFNVLTFGKTF